MLRGMIFLESVVIVIYFRDVHPIQSQQRPPAQNIVRRNTILDTARYMGISAVMITMQKFQFVPCKRWSDELIQQFCSSPNLTLSVLLVEIK